MKKPFHQRGPVAYAIYYRITEEGHHFHQEGDKFYRISRIYRETYDSATGTLIDRKLHWNNHSTVMFDPALIPADQIS